VTWNGKPVFSVPGRGPIDALRVLSLGDARGYVIALRRGASIWLGAIGADDAHARIGSLVELRRGSGLLGAPALARAKDRVLVAVASTDAADRWSVYTASWTPGEGAPPLVRFEPPAGGLGAHVMSPSLASAPGDRVLLVWTEGPVARHQIRAQLLDASSVPAGDALLVSDGTANAGQAAIALTRTGDGVIAFLSGRASSPAASYAVLAAPVRCAR
jgi:hypothetical protein